MGVLLSDKEENVLRKFVGDSMKNSIRRRLSTDFLLFGSLLIFIASWMLFIDRMTDYYFLILFIPGTVMAIAILSAVVFLLKWVRVDRELREVKKVLAKLFSE